jgi:Ser/Thr protein kinase RdoA (MazF antagonist)
VCLTRSVIDSGRLRDVLIDRWGLADVRVDVHNGGMNSMTWWVEHDGRRDVAKHTPGWNRDQFVGGITVASHVERAGVAAGAPIPTSSGQLVVETADGPVALLRYVPGDEPPDDETGLRVIGETLGRVHLAILDVQVEGAEEFHWVDPGAPHLERAPHWVKPGIAQALALYGALDPTSLTQGMLHTDPAPEAFRVDRATGSVGLIDWAVAMHGPLLYDLASAVMYAGGKVEAQPLIAAYAQTGALGEDEIRRGLDVFYQFRWAVQADYFAGRIAAADMTGIEDAGENEEGMLAAREFLE